jgi:RNA polymerase sigma factor (sigma-70 family)
MPRPKLTEEQRRIVEKNLPIAYAYVKRYRHSPWVRAFPTKDDARQSAVIALCEAVQTHKPERGALATVAFLAIHRRLKRESRRQHHIHLPRSVNSPHHIVPITPQRTPNDVKNTVSTTLGYKSHNVRDDYKPLASAIAHEAHTEQTVQNKDHLQLIAQHLDETERAIVIDSIYLHKQDPEIHDILQMPKQRVRHIRRKAIGKLRKALAGAALLTAYQLFSSTKEMFI